MGQSQGKKLREAIKNNDPLKIVGTINAYSALLAEKEGHHAIYLSGGGVAASSLGVPDLGISSLQDVLIDVERITNATSVPLLVDADTGWGGAFNIARTVKSFINYGAAGLHIEDQVSQKRCLGKEQQRLAQLQQPARQRASQRSTFQYLDAASRSAAACSSREPIE